jgi:hypothetical protein
MVALIIIFPNIVSYGDDAQREAMRLEKTGEGPAPVDLNTLMQGETNEDNKAQEPSADLLKNLQGGK